MSEKTGVLVYDFREERYDIYFGMEDYYGGLHCGECFYVKDNDNWVMARIELNKDGWYLVGIKTDSLYGLQVKMQT